MEMPSIPLALEAFLPVLLSGVGTFFLARLIRKLDQSCGDLASLGFLLITLGSFLHALWKLLLATNALNISVLNYSLFIFTAPGFVLLAWALWNTFYGGPSGTPVWVVPVIIIVVGGGAAAINALSKGGQRWFYILLGLATIAQIVMAVLLAWQSWRRGLQFAALMFIFYLIMISVQASFFRFLASSLTLQWIGQTASTIFLATFAYASWQLERNITGKR